MEHELADLIRALRPRVDRSGPSWTWADQGKLGDDLMSATEAAEQAGRLDVALQLANCRRALERREVSRAGVAILEALRLALGYDRAA